MAVDFRDEAPAILKDYLIYKQTIKNMSKKTVDEYFIDLRTFFRFLKVMRGLVPDGTEFDEIKIDDVDLSSPVLKKADGKGTPYLEKSAKGARVDNFVVYLNDDSLEKYYSSVNSYNNSASGFISFSDLKTDYNFKVIGAFYTNTKASDDNGYVFPYNVTEQMEPSSALEFYTMLHYRFLYDTGASPIRSDKLITISCPTSYHKDFRFVVVGVARDDDKKLTASPKKLIRYPQVICDEKGIRNHFASAKPWYPQIVITAEKDNTTTTKIIDTKKAAGDRCLFCIFCYFL